MKKRYRNNAERQRAYRERNRNARTPPLRGSAAKPRRVTVDDTMERCSRFQFIYTDWRGEKVYAKVTSSQLCEEGRCPHCDEDRKRGVSPVVNG